MAELHVQVSGAEVILEGSKEDLQTEIRELRNSPLRLEDGDPVTSCQPETLSCEASVCRVRVTSCLPSGLTKLSGKTFEMPGPNCFATALRIRNLAPTFRGVGKEEFEEFVQQNCERVTQPQPGDLGVFSAGAFGALHAYVYVSKSLGFEKPGVDEVLGKTPLALKARGQIMYRNEATPECRRYSPDWRDCANDHFFVRCSAPRAASTEALATFDQEVLSFDRLIHHWLNQSHLTTPDELALLKVSEEKLLRLKAQLEQIPAEASELRLRAARLISLTAQLTYIQLRSAPHLFVPSRVNP